MENNFVKISEITVPGVNRPDVIVQHETGWYARCRVIRGRMPKCPHCSAYFHERGVKPATVLRAYAVECDAEGGYTGEPLEVVKIISPSSGADKTIYWQDEAKRAVRDALDLLLLARAELPEPDEDNPL